MVSDWGSVSTDDGTVSTTGSGTVVVAEVVVVVDVEVVVSGSSTGVDEEGSVTGATLLDPASPELEQAARTHTAAVTAAPNRNRR